MFPITYLSCEEISFPHDNANQIKLRVGSIQAYSILGISNDQNVREYKAGAGVKKKKSSIHNAIYETAREDHEKFYLLNNGITLIADNVQIDKVTRTLFLENPSIINGAQTQGVLKDLFEEITDEGELEKLKKELVIKFELIVIDSKDQDTVDEMKNEISIARNRQHKVEDLTISGSQGCFDELEQALQKDPKFKNKQLLKSETDSGGEFVPTERLLQVMFVLTPVELLVDAGFIKTSSSHQFRSKFYSGKSSSFKWFCSLYDNMQQEKPRSEYTKLYNFLLNITPLAWNLYLDWQKHPKYEGKNLKNAVNRSHDGTIDYAHFGFIMPILAAFSLFYDEVSNNLELPTSSKLDMLEEQLINRAKNIFSGNAKSDPQTMGKGKGVDSYDSMVAVTQMFLAMALTPS
jgi:hypothetical protein